MIGVGLARHGTDPELYLQHAVPHRQPRRRHRPSDGARGRVARDEGEGVVPLLTVGLLRLAGMGCHGSKEKQGGGSGCGAGLLVS
jgi:hypothetical protein